MVIGIIPLKWKQEGSRAIKMIKFIISIFITMLFIIGCVPYPHLYQRLPIVSGTMTDNGTPIEGVQISLGEISGNGSCVPIQGPIVSANDGSFSFQGVKHIRLFVSAVPGEHFEKWALCIKAKDREPITFRRGRMRPGPLSSPESVKLICDLSKKNICDVMEEINGKW